MQLKQNFTLEIQDEGAAGLCAFESGRSVHSFALAQSLDGFSVILA
jgi:hypothetical protein